MLQPQGGSASVSQSQAPHKILARAAQDLPPETSEWVRKAQAAELAGTDLTAIRRTLLRSGDPGDLERLRQDGRIDALRSQLDQLDQFVTMARIVRDDIEGLLVAVEAASQAGTDPPAGVD